MKKDKLVDAYIELLKEEKETVLNISKLPKGYIDPKMVSGKLYYFRQWRENDKVKSEYVPEAKINSLKRKIEIRKSQESLLKTIKKEIKQLRTKILKLKLITEEELDLIELKATQN